MTPAEYLDAAKKALNVSSDYELAKRLSIPNGNIPPMRRGERNIPLDVAFRLAITLKLDPSEVVADLEAQREKNPDRAEFWKSFLLRAQQTAVCLLCTLVLISSAGLGSGPGAIGGGPRFRRAFGCA